MVEAFEASREGIAEAAFAVAADWRGRGLARTCLQPPDDGRNSPASEPPEDVHLAQQLADAAVRDKAGARRDLDLDEILADTAVATAASLDIAA